MQVIALILAAGKGTRMRSDRAKVLHTFLGRPLILHPLIAAHAWGAERAIVVVGHQAAEVERAVEAWRPSQWPVEYVVQSEQRGTGHAVLCGLPVIGEFTGFVFVLSGDVPLLTTSTLDRLALAGSHSSAGLALASFRPPDPTGYGRILRDAEGRVTGIREQRDAGADERAITECNAGVYCVAAEHLRAELPKLAADNAAGEIYLTDLVAIRAGAGQVAVVEVGATEVAGVNTPQQLAELEALAHHGPG